MEKEKVLNAKDLRQVTVRRDICGATVDYRTPITFCTNNVDEAEAYAGAMGWWCCNCKEALDICSKILEDGEKHKR